MWNGVLKVHRAAKDIGYFEDSSLQGSDIVSGGRVFPSTGLLGPAFPRSGGNSVTSQKPRILSNFSVVKRRNIAIIMSVESIRLLDFTQCLEEHK
jgi:hypothetical protein